MFGLGAFRRGVSNRDPRAWVHTSFHQVMEAEVRMLVVEDD